jgi:membrane protein YqaA with SNARE-associated domain
MSGWSKKLYDWASRKAQSRFAALWLGIIIFLEMVFFLPMDAILLLFCLENPSRRYHYSLVATTASVASSLVGYLLGFAAWESLSPYVLDHWISSEFFTRISLHYQQHQHWAVFIGSFLPIPFKAITLSAGVCEFALLPFLLAVLLARLSRFFLIAHATSRWGLQIKAFLNRHFHNVILAIGAKIALAITFFWILT